MPIRPPSHLPDQQLTRALDDVASRDRTSDAVVLAHVAEFDARKLYLPASYPSMRRYCVDHLRMSEDVASKRVWVARIARRVPSVFDAIEAGRLNLSGVALLARHLTRQNAAEVLAAAEGKTRDEIKLLIAHRFPGAATLVAGVVPQHAAAEQPSSLATESQGEALPLANVTTASSEHAPGHVHLEAGCPNAAAPALPARFARVEPIAPGRFELVAILGQEAYDQLVGSHELLGHAVPSGALVEVLERAIALQFTALCKRRCGTTERPRAGATQRSANQRSISKEVRREVWKRDGGRCAFVGEGGHRCGSRKLVEIDHVVPVARGGQSTVANLRLLCRPHNQHTAECEFGKRLMQNRREAEQRRRIAERMTKQAEAKRAEARKAELKRQHDELGEAFRNLGYRGGGLRRALAHCATRPEAPAAERLKYALSCMAPNARRELPTPTAGHAARESGETNASSAAI